MSGNSNWSNLASHDSRQQAVRYPEGADDNYHPRDHYASGVRGRSQMPRGRRGTHNPRGSHSDRSARGAASDRPRHERNRYDETRYNRNRERSASPELDIPESIRLGVRDHQESLKRREKIKAQLVERSKAKLQAKRAQSLVPANPKVSPRAASSSHGMQTFFQSCFDRLADVTKSIIHDITTQANIQAIQNCHLLSSQMQFMRDALAQNQAQMNAFMSTASDVGQTNRLLNEWTQTIRTALQGQTNQAAEFSRLHNAIEDAKSRFRNVSLLNDKESDDEYDSSIKVSQSQNLFSERQESLKNLRLKLENRHKDITTREGGLDRRFERLINAISTVFRSAKWDSEQVLSKDMLIEKLNVNKISILGVLQLCKRLLMNERLQFDLRSCASTTQLQRVKASQDQYLELISVKSLQRCLVTYANRFLDECLKYACTVSDGNYNIFYQDWSLVYGLYTDALMLSEEDLPPEASFPSTETIEAKLFNGELVNRAFAVDGGLLSMRSLGSEQQTQDFPSQVGMISSETVMERQASCIQSDFDIVIGCSPSGSSDGIS